MIRQNRVGASEIHLLTLRDLPEGSEKAALLRRRFALGLSMCPNGRVMVDEDGRPLVAEEVPMRLRFAKFGSDLDGRQRPLLPRTAGDPLRR